MIICEKIEEIEFLGENHKDAYLKATKYAAKYIKYDCISFCYKKVEYNKIKMTIYYQYDDTNFAKHRCECCKEFKSSFFIDMSPDTNCSACRQDQYRKAIKKEMKRLIKIKGF
jgi:hypothetical protein